MKQYLLCLLTVVLTAYYGQAQETPPHIAAQLAAGRMEFYGPFIENFNEPASHFFFLRRNDRPKETDFRVFQGIPSWSEKGTNIMLFRLDPEDRAGAGRGPEVISNKFTHFGTYATRLRIPDVTKAQPDVGAVVGYFTYHRDAVHGLSEIDWEWLIADPEILYIGTWTGRGSLQRIGRTINLAKGTIYSTYYRAGSDRNQPLTGEKNNYPETIQPIEGFNAASQFYTYGFDWYPDRLVWWILHPTTNEKIILWDYTGSTPNFTGIPPNPTLYRLNFWHTNNWPVETRRNSTEKPLYPYELEIDWMSYTPFEDLNKAWQEQNK